MKAINMGIKNQVFLSEDNVRRSMPKINTPEKSQ